MHNGIWSCTASVERYAQAGTWRASVRAKDNLYQERNYAAPDLQAMGFPFQLIVVDTNEDAAAPELGNLDFNPKSVDVSAGSATVSCQVAASDPVSGVYWIGCDFVSPSFNQYASCGSWSPVSGNAHNGVWVCAATVPQNSESGSWQVEVRTKDYVYQERTYRATDLQQLGLPSQMLVSSIPDNDPPVLTGFDFTPKSVDATTASASVDCDVSATDALAGVFWIGCEFYSPSNGQIAGCGSWAPVSGNGHDGMWSCSATVPRYAESGTWFSHVRTKDNLYRERDYAPSEIATLGFPASLVVCVDHLGRDADGDAHGDDCDNCPSLANLDQADGDLDRVGDACDDCRFDFNPTQSDVDSDGSGDMCDLSDGLIYARSDVKTRIDWQQETGWTKWNVYRGDLDVLRSSGVYTQAVGSNPLADRDCGLSSTFLADPDDPPPGKVRFHLVTGVKNHTESSLGSNSAGVQRPNANPCPH
jgi:hypothetical protein